MGCIGRIQKIEYARSLVFDLQDRRMRVRQQHQPLATQSQFFEETSRTRQPGDSTRLLTMYGCDIDVELFAPVVDRIPLQRALYPMKSRCECRVGLGEREPLSLCVDFRDPCEPDVVIEGEIKQGAVEIEQHGVDSGPVRSIGSEDIHAGMIPAE